MSASDQELLERSRGRLGTTLKGKYRLDRVLGIGGMAVVYAATHRNGKEFALKMLHPEHSLNSDVRNRFLREGYVANKVKHPGAVAVLDDDLADDGAAFLVMELLEGESVETVCERQGGRLPLPTVIALGYQLLSVLAAAHANGIVHRDIKPANLFLTHEGQLKVLDFGIARLRDVATSHATQTGMMMGTPAFMAPEQAMAKTAEIDGQTDLWSAGATLFALASGKLVHEADNAQQLLIIAATTPARSLATVMPEAPPQVVSVVDRALAFDKNKRWASALEMRDALKDVQMALYGGAPSAQLLAPPAASAEDAKYRTAPMDSRPRASTPGLDIPASLRGVTQPLTPTPVGRPVVAEARPAALTTEQPVARDRVGRSDARSRVPLLSMAIGAAVVAIGVAVVVVMFARGGSPERATSSAVPSTAVATPSPSVSLAPVAIPSAPTETAGASSAPTTVAVDQLPTAAPPTTAGTPPPKPTSTATSKPTPTSTPSTTAAPSKPGCTPPFVIDPKTGKKNWKMECL
jgi:serine/threonine protein kinase